MTESRSSFTAMPCLLRWARGCNAARCKVFHAKLTIMNCRYLPLTLFVLTFAILTGLQAGSATAQVRSKKVDRGTYRGSQTEPSTPVTDKFKLQPVVLEDPLQQASSIRQVAGEVIVSPRVEHELTPPIRVNRTVSTRPVSAPMGLTDPIHSSIHPLPPVDGHIVYHDSGYLDQGGLFGNGYGGDTSCDGASCDSAYCDGGCDSMGCTGGIFGGSNARLALSPDQWFGTLEILTMVRSGDFLPVLVTSGADADNAGDTTLVGNQTIFDDTTAGGRLTVGAYLDDAQCRSLVARIWSATEDDFNFQTDNNATTVIGRPFFDVTDGQVAADNVNIVAAPNRANGAISVDGSSDVYGGDLSVRQYLYGRFGGSVDFLYGYQYMRLDENLAIRGTSVSTDENFAPVGSTIAIADSFDVENAFHGGQFGVSTSYREGCWSFDALAKFGFGSLRREVDRSGSTTTSSGGLTATENQGLLVRQSNSGKTTDHTFGWVPELDLNLGYRKFACYDLTIGYHVIAMTDALQVSGAIDRDLASNLATNPTGSLRPSGDLRFDTFHVHGVHFGLRYDY